MDGDIMIIGMFTWILSLLAFVFIIRKAIDGSKKAEKMEIIINEIRMLRKEINENNHIIDKKCDCKVNEETLNDIPARS